MIELSYFDKYSPEESDNEYKTQKIKMTKLNNHREIPSYKQLATAVNYLTTPSLGLSGQIICLDNGILNVQNF